MTTPSLADKVPSVASWGTSEQRKVDVRVRHLTTKTDIREHCACSELLQSCSVNSTPALPSSLLAAALSAQSSCDEKISTTGCDEKI